MKNKAGFIHHKVHKSQTRGRKDSNIQFLKSSSCQQGKINKDLNHDFPSCLPFKPYIGWNPISPLTHQNESLSTLIRHCKF